MIFDTLQYVDGAGTTQEIALPLQNVATIGGGVRVKFTPRSHAPSTFEISWAQPPETGIAIPFKSRCVVYASRSSTAGAPNTFSGGTIIFQGRRTDNEGSASASRVLTTITLSDALWDLGKITLQIVWKYISGGTLGSPTYSNFNWPDIVLFQPIPGTTYSPAPVVNTITTWQQIQDIIAYAVAFATGANAVQLQLGSVGFTPVYCNWYPMRAGKCLECLTTCLRPHPGVYTEIDYSTSPPTLHFRNRANLTAATLPYKSTLMDGTFHIASDIQPLDQLVPDAVRLYYKINGMFNGQPVGNFATDIYPAAAPNSLLCLDYSIDITGEAKSETRVNFTSAAFDPTSFALWRTKVPALKQENQGGQIPNDGSAGALVMVDTAAYDATTHPKGIQVIDDSGAVIDFSSGHYQYYVEKDPVYSWFTLSSGAAVSAVRATVKAFFAYDKVTTQGGGNVTDTFGEHEHHFRVVLTNAPSSIYVLKQTLNVGESIPSGLAEAVFTELADLQWKLNHEVIQTAADATSVPTLIKPGKHKINLSGGDTAWETMNAVPENVGIELFRAWVNKNDGSGSEWRLVARHQINCGPVNHLEPGYLVQLTNLFWNRNKSGIDAYQRLTGTTASSQVDLSGNSTKENSTSAEPVPVVTNNVWVTGGAIAGQMIANAKTIADILAATTPTPVVDATGMKTMTPREFACCTNAGDVIFTILHGTSGHTKP